MNETTLAVGELLGLFTPSTLLGIMIDIEMGCEPGVAYPPDDIRAILHAAAYTLIVYHLGEQKAMAAILDARVAIQREIAEFERIGVQHYEQN